jgi:hypothetical protein
VIEYRNQQRSLFGAAAYAHAATAHARRAVHACWSAAGATLAAALDDAYDVATPTAVPAAVP